MKMFSPFSLPGLTAQPPSALEHGDGRPGEALSADTPSFASLMGAQMSRAEAPRTATPPVNPPAPAQPPQHAAAPARHPEGSNNNGGTHDAGSANRARERAAERSAQARARDQAPRPARSDTAPATNKEAGDTQRTQDAPRDAGHDDTTTSADGRTLAEWLAALSNPLDPASAVRPGKDNDATADDTSALGDAAGEAGHRVGGNAARRLAGAEGGPGQADTRALQQQGRFEPDAAQAQPLAAAMQQAHAEPVLPATTERPVADHAAAALAGTAPVHEASASAAAPEPAGVQVATTTHDPDFPDVLATQVSVLVKDGVQEAKLHLNPAEMGPVSVQIAVDGTSAHVDFTAAAGATRDLIETSLPMLAAALHGAGLTLSGGGVFQQPRNQGDAQPQSGEAASPRGRAGASADAVAAAAPQRRPMQPRGMLDLYA